MPAQHGFIVVRRVLLEKIQQFFGLVSQVSFIVTPVLVNGIFTQ
jgi:hypothetical protein